MKTWIKGGIWGLGISVLLGIILLPITMWLIMNFFGKIFNCPYQATAWIIPGSYNCQGILGFFLSSLSCVIYLGIFFIIGALIGKNIEKNKSTDNQK